jgi:hypothetical protein
LLLKDMIPEKEADGNNLGSIAEKDENGNPT